MLAKMKRAPVEEYVTALSRGVAVVVPLFVTANVKVVADKTSERISMSSEAFRHNGI